MGTHFRMWFSESLMSVELDGDVGCCNLLLRAMQSPADTGDVTVHYVAQELRRVGDIDGSVMSMLLTHSNHLVAAAFSPSVQQLLRQLPSVLPTSLQQFLARQSAFSAVCSEFHLRCSTTS